MIDNFEQNSLTNINFDGIFDGNILSTNYEDNSALVFIPRLMISANNEYDIINAIEPINNTNIINNKITKNSVKTTNGIWCKPLTKNQQAIVPNKDEHVIVLFIDGDPQKAYYINYNLYNIINETDFTKKLKGQKHDINILDAIDDFSMVYDKTTKCFTITNKTQQIMVCPNKTYFLDDGKEIDYTGPKGEDGRDGKDGIDGTDGTNGADGIDGKDGKDGKDGRDGTDGEQGIQGIDGLDGKDGIDGLGLNGRDGIDGTDGTDGVDGKDGKDGKDGRDGTDGEQGIQGIDGLDGKDGIDGLGLNGRDGTDGTNGKDGADGTNGTDGVDGKDGKDGKDGEPKDWDSLDNKPAGLPGQAYFIGEESPTSVRLDYTLHEGIFIETDQELIDAKGVRTTFKEVFDSWERFSHHINTSVQPAMPTEMEQWSYDSVADQVLCKINSESYIGFVSKDKYETFKHEATLLADRDTSNDDDTIALVIAFTKDLDGKEHTLSAIRVRNADQGHVTVGTQNVQWAIVYNYRQANAKLIKTAKVNETVSATGQWNKVPEGTRVFIDRKGDIITASTTAFNTPDVIDESSKLQVDLSSDPLLTIFRGAKQYGFSCISQTQSTFKDLVFTGNERPIYDLRNRDVWVWNGLTWVLDAEKNLYTDFGIGKFLYNDTTKKLFYVKGIDDIERIDIGSNSSEPVDNTVDFTQFKSFRTFKILKWGTVTVQCPANILSTIKNYDISNLTFSSKPTIMSYVTNNDGALEAIPQMIVNDNLQMSRLTKTSVSAENLKIHIQRTAERAKTSEEVTVTYYILDVDNALTLPLPESIKVLNIHPTVAGTYTFTNWKGETSTLSQASQVKKWMEEPNADHPKGYGQGLINVDTVTVAEFNVDPDKYMKNTDGSWKYNVIYYGAWDSNDAEDFSQKAVSAIKVFIADNMGYIGGHDTATLSVASFVYNNQLATNMNIALDSSVPWSGDSNVSVTKEGLLTTFPWDLGSTGNQMVVPRSHSTAQFAMGDVWFEYTKPETHNGGKVITELNGKKGTNNFYLNTWKNTAMIQTGHSNGLATPDEQKILANTFYYLSTFTI